MASSASASLQSPADGKSSPTVSAGATNGRSKSRQMGDQTRSLSGDDDLTLPVPRLSKSPSAALDTSLTQIRKSAGDMRVAENLNLLDPMPRPPIAFTTATPKVDEKVIRDKVALQYRSMFLFPRDNPLRIVVFKLTHHRFFEAFVIFAIFANCFFLAMDDPTVTADKQPQYLRTMEFVFTGIFAVEMCLKVFSQGFVLHVGSYLRSGWNMLDFLIVMLSFLAFLPIFGNYSAIRMLRVMRPLRSINGIQGLKNIVNGLLFSVRKLVNVIALAAFLFFIFGIIGVQLWSGKFGYRCQACLGCTDEDDSFNETFCVCFDQPMANLTQEDRFCRPGAVGYGMAGNFWGRPCDAGFNCVDTMVNPNFGFTSFDNIGSAFLAIFQCITMEGWVDIMYIVQDVWGDLGCVYFIMLVVLGSFFVLNLALAVINEQFNTIRAETEREREEALERMHRALLLAAETLETGQLLEGDQVLVRDHPDEHWQTGYVVSANALGPAIVHTEDGIERTWLMYQCLDHEEMEGHESESHDDDLSPHPPVSPRHHDARLHPASDTVVHMEGADGHMHAAHHHLGVEVATPAASSRGHASFASRSVAGTGDVHDERHHHVKKQNIVAVYWLKFRWVCYRIVAFRYFQPFIIICIVINTGLLASEHHGQPDSLTSFLDRANVVLTMIFCVEMVLKIIASGFRGYVADPFNVLDGIVVMMSLVEFVFSGSSSVSVFRALRLLRVFKLLKNFPELRKLIGVCMHAIRDTGYLNSIILLYIFIAALVGMQFFGGEFDFPDREPRATFDSFYWSLLSVFQILTRDDWVVIMWDAMQSAGHASAVYFLVLVVCGDFLILNLFLAILIQSFDTSMSSTDDDGDDDDDDDKDEVAPPGALTEEERVRQSILSNPVVRRASVMVNVVNHANTVHGKPHHGEGDILGHGGRLVSARDLKKHIQKHSSFRELGAAGGKPSFILGGERFSSLRMKSRLLGDASHRSSRAVSHSPGCDDGDDLSSLLSAGSPGEGAKTTEYNRLLHNLQSSYAETILCPECNERYVAPPRPGDPTSYSIHIPHEDVCETIQLRKMRMARLRQVAHRIRDDVKKHTNLTFWSVEYVERVLGDIWEVGVLIDVTPAAWQAAPVDAALEELDRQMSAVNLQVGEEVVGRSLLRSVFANKPVMVQTNGGNSLCLFGEESSVRLLCCRIVKHQSYENFILVCIIVSSLLLAIENPRNDLTGTKLGDVLTICNYTFTSIFVVEMTLKLIAFGLVFGKSDPDPPYLRDSWNVMDGMIVVVSVLSLVPMADSSSELTTFRVLRTFRALRPLRVISRNRGLRMVVITLMQSIGGIGNVAVISLLVFLVFGILGVQLLAGKLYHCTDTTVTYREACYGWFLDEEGEFQPRRWTNKSNQRFDNIIWSLITLFEIATLELWSTIMYSCIDGVSKDRAPIRDHNKFVGLFFVAFVVVGGFFVINLFVGVVIHNYNEVKVREDGLHFLSGEQKLWIETQRMMLNFKPAVKMVVPWDPWRRYVYNLVQTNGFDMFVGTCITLNVLLMSLEHHDMSPSFTLILEIGNWIFSFIFFMEAVMKLTAYSLSYFKDPWNRFDFLLVLLSLLDVFLVTFEETGLPINASILRVFRIFRIMRILRLVKAARDVRILLETVWYSLPSIANIGAFLALLFFIFAILGVNQFANVKRGEYLTYHANFETFPNAILLLFRIVTGENWNGIMWDTMVESPDCGNDPKRNDCGLIIAPLYYVSFLLMAGFVLINLFVAIILDNFGTTMQIEKSELRFNDLHKFIDMWADFDPAAKLTIRTLSLPKFLERLGPPLGISRRTSRVEILKRTQNYCIPEHGGVIHFIETIIPLARHVMNERWQDSLEHRDLRDQEDSWRQAFPDINDLPVMRVRQRRVTVDQYFASTYIAAAYRRRRAIESVSKMKKSERVSICSFQLTQLKLWGCFPQGTFETDQGPEEDVPQLKQPARPEDLHRAKRRIVKLFSKLHGLRGSEDVLRDLDVDTALIIAQDLLHRALVTGDAVRRAIELLPEAVRAKGGAPLRSKRTSRIYRKRSRDDNLAIDVGGGKQQ